MNLRESVLLTATQDSTPVGEYCKISFNETWVDVMFLIESTKWMTRDGLNEVTDFIATSVSKLPVGQEQGKRTRVG
ncbi:hypothetical protein ANCCAN_05248 [Ancylostoma caninum]|uniref:VWFA domain-containing protein n=1 Tax=Ancylostoma caninum TaxID=29170 RepID=A0A368H037_ANCCA|nr:hypothetical protein ANCCAN_05248 [Ancylostoma caninum]